MTFDYDFGTASDYDYDAIKHIIDPPKRIQRQRTRGWRMPEGAVYVGRPTEWGNPWRVGDRLMLQWPLHADEQTCREVVITPGLAVELYRIAFTPDAPEARERFAGRDLACWCPLDMPCHADVLLQLANNLDTQETR